MVQLRKQYTYKKESLQHIENVLTNMKHSLFLYMCMYIYYIILCIYYTIYNLLYIN